MKYRKKPIVIEAEQFFPDCHPWPKGVHGVNPNHPNFIIKDSSKVTAWGIQTLEGWHLVSPGDWIITGIKGEHYPVKPDIFELTYERIFEDRKNVS